MPLHTMLKQLTRSIAVLILVVGLVGSVLPQQVSAQNGPSGAEVNGPLLGGPQDNGLIPQIVNAITGNTGSTGTGGGSGDAPSGSGSGWFGGGSSGSSGGGGWFNEGGLVDSALDTGADLVGGFLNILGAIGHTLDGNPVTDLFGNAVDVLHTAVEGVVNTGIDLGIEISSEVFDTTDMGEPAGGNALSPGSQAGGSTYGGGGVIQSGQTVTLPSGQNLTLTQGQTATVNPNGSVTIHLTNGHTAVISSEGYVTEYNAQGQATNSNDPSVNPGNWNNSAGNGNGPSIPGASIGTVGNPFSDGSDKDDAPSNNEEDTSNPYLFEYDPSSTNNNPSGAGALDN